MVSFIDDHREAYGVGPICEVLPIAPSTYYTHKAIQADPSLRSPRAQRDEWLKCEVRRVWKENRELYGAEKVWKQLNREGISVAWCTVRRRLVHHSDRGVQYLSIRYTERLAEEGIEPSVGSVGDSYDNALAESIIGLFKTEVIRRLGPWRNVEDVEFATLEWVWWFNYHRLLGPIGHVPPVEYEEAYYMCQEGSIEAVGLKENSLR
jgi:transposase InsO family protein